MKVRPRSTTQESTSRTGNGFSLIEVVFAVVLSMTIVGVIGASMVTSLRVAKSTTQQVADATDAGLASSFLIADAQSAGSIDPAGGATGPNLGVSTTDAGGCGSGTPVVRFGWLERASSTPTTKIVSYFSTAKTENGVSYFQLSRRVCETSQPDKVVILADRLGTAPTAACQPNPSCIDARSVQLSIKGSGAAAPIRTMTATVRVLTSNLTITAPALPATGTVGVAYTPTTMAATGGTGTYAWTVSSGLPAGLAMSSTGVWSGVPTTAQTYAVVVTVTDNAAVPAHAQRAYQVVIGSPTLAISTATLPAGQKGAAYTSTTMAATGGTGAYTWSFVSGQPAGLVMSAAGVVTGTPTTAGVYPNVVVQVTDAASTIASRTYSINVTAAPLVISTATLPAGTRGVAYTSTTMAATGGTGAYTWSFVSGQPAGLVMSSTGVLTGTPTTAGTYAAVIVRVTDAASVVTDKTFSITINAAPLVISTATLPAGTRGVAYPSTTMAATGGTGAYTWTITSGLPAGLSMSTAGVWSGTPTTVATYSVIVKVTDAAAATVSKTFTVSVTAPALVISTATLPAGTRDVAYPSTTMAATGGTGAYTWTITSGLPAGLSMSTAGVWSGTPTTVATYSVIVKVTDAAAVSTSKTFSVQVKAPALVISTATLPAGQRGVVYPSTTMAATGGTGAYTWTITSGLPAGLSMSTAGVWSGTPTTVATYSVIVKVTDAAAATVSKTFSVPVTVPPLVISTSSLPAGQKSVAYPSTTMAATGGTGAYTWTITSGLPAGLSMSTAGVWSGTPTTVATYSVIVKVTDAAAATVSKTFSVTIGATPLVVSAPVSLPSGQVSMAYTSTTVSATGGTGAYTWTASGLPPGLAISTGGVISGTPTTSGSYASIIVTVTDAASVTATKTYSVAITSVLAISGPLLPDGQVGLPYTSTTMTRTGGTSPYTWSATGLPPGLTINSSSGVVSGAPTLLGSYSVTIRVTDAIGATATTADTVVIAAAAGGCPALQDSWTGQYYNNITLAGTPVLVREDDFLDFYWGTNSPGPGVNSDNFSVRWTRSADLAAGTYQIVVNSEDGARLYVDGVKKLDKWNEHAYPGTPTTVNVPLTQGSHTFVVEYYNVSGLARVDLDATLPGNEVSAGPRSCGDKRYFGQNQITLATSAQITAMTLTIKVAQTTGVTYSDHYVTVPAGRITETQSTSGGFITYTFTLDAGDRIDAGVWTLAAQYAGNGTLHATSGDTWSITTTTSTGTRTVGGNF